MSAESGAANDVVRAMLSNLRLPYAIIAGSFVAGYPLYTVGQCWRLQHGSRTSFIELFKLTKQRQGWSGLYKGASPPLPIGE